MQSAGSRPGWQWWSTGSVVVGHGLGTCGARAQWSVACGIFPDQGLASCLLQWQADSLLLSQQGNSDDYFYIACVCILF